MKIGTQQNKPLIQQKYRATNTNLKKARPITASTSVHSTPLIKTILYFSTFVLSAGLSLTINGEVQPSTLRITDLEAEKGKAEK